jgi:transcriptional regulator GlxA family with amidase domain
MVFHYISTDLEPTLMTVSIRISPTVTYDQCTRNLDILLIGGALLDHRPEAAHRFMKEAAKTMKIILTTCIGSLVSTGALDGKTVTTNRGMLGLAKAQYPKVNWADERWVIDGKIWTSGGAGAGIDMIGVFARVKWNMDMGDEGKKFVNFELYALDIDPDARGRYYKD